VIYQVSDYAITVFTDTTERSPTFSLPAFDNRLHPRVKPSLVYVEIGAAPTPHAAWLQLLHRDPRPLDWDGVDHRATQDYLAGFDFSRSVTSWRRSLRADFPQAHFAIESDADAIVWRLEDLELRMGVADLDLLSRHLLLKMILNQHSTLVMGRLGRYYTNLMTYVRPNNAKLIDRAARYVGILLADAGRTDVAYDSIVREIFRRKEALAEDEAIVMSVFAALRGGDAHR
jgi:N-acetylmuramic acid 6-phosphate etherase